MNSAVHKPSGIPSHAPPRQHVRVLESIVVNQIAAGEVVERPASVVKELVENSLDAYATVISVVIDNGGQTNIEVIDNGWGMEREDAYLALERFGTSKIRDLSDLERVSTLGFRGEALPSIASVSYFTLTTRPREDSSGRGVRITVEGGKVMESVELAAPVGTHVQVRKLFWNVPARRRFLRSEGTETALIRTVLGDLAATAPGVDFRLVVDGREVAHFPPQESFHARCEQLGLRDGKGLVVDGSVSTPSGEIRIQALLGIPSSAVSNPNRLRILVNGRAVREKTVLRAVRDAYGSILKPGSYPAGVIRVDLPAEDVDVNVHPQKAEVRFRASESVYRAVRSQVSAVIETVSASEVGGGRFVRNSTSPSFRGQMPILAPILISSQRAPGGGRRQFCKQVFSGEGVGGMSPGDVARLDMDCDERRNEEPPPRKPLSTFRYVGQLFDCFLVLEGEGELAVVDMHAAHERVVFVKLKEQLATGTLKTQSLILPEPVTLPPHLVPLFGVVLEISAQCGIEAERCSENELLVRSLPAILGTMSAKEVFAEIIELMDSDLESSVSVPGEALSRLQEAVLARIACHGSIRRGRRLEREEVYALLDQFEAAETSAFCPHGRPIVCIIAQQELEELFARN